ncbi:hypothetical protein [Shewanella sp. 5S214]|uniref:hypothetical protein n=1 Tax=Alteromonadales TaxID=135622 RepID=UPI00352C7E52
MTKIFREPPEWGWFIGILIMSIREIIRGHYLGLLTGIPFLLVAILAPEKAQKPLWVLFTLGSLANFIIAVSGTVDYISGAIYLSLVVYGADEVYKILVKNKKS